MLSSKNNLQNAHMCYLCEWVSKMEFGVVYLLGKYVKLQETFFKRVYIPYLNIPNSLLQKRMFFFHSAQQSDVDLTTILSYSLDYRKLCQSQVVLEFFTPVKANCVGFKMLHFLFTVLGFFILFAFGVISSIYPFCISVLHLQFLAVVFINT